MCEPSGPTGGLLTPCVQWEGCSQDPRRGSSGQRGGKAKKQPQQALLSPFTRVTSSSSSPCARFWSEFICAGGAELSSEELMQMELRKEISVRGKRLQQRNAQQGVFGRTLEDVLQAESLRGIPPSGRT